MRFIMPAAFAATAAASPTSAAVEQSFHTHLTKSEPSANDTLAVAPRAVRLWFTEKVELVVTTVKLTDAAGAAIPLAPLARPDTGEQAPVVATLNKSLVAGSYVVAWSTAAKDGHPAKGSFAFVVRAVH